MKYSDRNKNIFDLVLYIFLMFFIFSCSVSEDDNSFSQSGMILFDLELQQSDSGQDTTHAVTSAAEYCQNAGIVTIEVNLYDDANNLLAEEGPFSCPVKNSWTIQNVSEGLHYKIVVLSKDSQGNIIHRAEKTNISVLAGEVTNVETIRAYSFIPTYAVHESEDAGQWLVNIDEVPGGATGYHIVVSSNRYLTDPVADTITTNRIFTMDKPLEDITHYFKITALDSDGNESSAEIKAIYDTIPLGEASISGVVQYSGKPMSEVTGIDPHYLFLDDAGQPFPDIVMNYDNTTGRFEVYYVPEKCEIIVNFNITGGANTLPGNFRYSERWDINLFPETEYNIHMLKIINLIEPWNNKNIVDSPPPYFMYGSTVTFEWESLPEANLYKIVISKYRDFDHPDGYGIIESDVVSQEIVTTSFGNVNAFEISEPNEHYVFNVSAFKDSSQTGLLMITYYDNNGSDGFKFKVGIKWFKDADNDGYSDGISEVSNTRPVGYRLPEELSGIEGDCNDDVFEINPDELEICNNIDDNCDGRIDEDLTRPTKCGLGICEGNTGIETCTAGNWGDDTCDPISGSEPEICDYLDNDCDGTVDDLKCECENGNIHITSCGVGNCIRTGTITCVNGYWTDNTCQEGTPIDEICGNDIDEDCNGVDFSCDDVDNDGDGITENQGDCDDGDENIFPGALELCDNTDNDCNDATVDGSSEAWYGVQCDGPDSDECMEGESVCTDGQQSCSDNTGNIVEICDGQDNDCDDMVDENGTYCSDACDSCEGRVDRLTMQYDGTLEAVIKVKQRDGDVVFENTVKPDGQFSFIGTEGRSNTLGAYIRIYVDGDENTKIETDCDEPIGPGLVIGDFTIIEGHSKDGGLLCPL